MVGSGAETAVDATVIGGTHQQLVGNLLECFQGFDWLVSGVGDGFFKQDRFATDRGALQQLFGQEFLCGHRTFIALDEIGQCQQRRDAGILLDDLLQKTPGPHQFGTAFVALHQPREYFRQIVDIMTRNTLESTDGAGIVVFQKIEPSFDHTGTDALGV